MIFLSVLVTACLVCLVLFHLIPPNRANVPSDPTKETHRTDDSNNLIEKLVNSQTDIDLSPLEAEVADPTTNRLLLGDECAETLDENALSDEECLAALEVHFIDQPAYTLNLFGMSPKPSPFTFREMFDNYERDRELVKEALSRPECNLMDGPIRVDLKEICNADAVFRLVQFANLCMFHVQFQRVRTEYFRTNEHGYEAELKRLEDLKSEDPPRGFLGEWDGGLGRYYAKRNQVRERVLREAWLDKKGKCKQIDWDIPPHEINEIAARLGFEPLFLADSRTQSTLLHWTIGTLGHRDNEFKESVEKSFSWVSQLNSADWNWNPRNHATRVAAVVRALAEMRNAGYETDLLGVVNRLCIGDHWDEEPSYHECSQAIAEAEQLLEPTDLDSLRLLDELVLEAMTWGH